MASPVEMSLQVMGVTVLCARFCEPLAVRELSCSKVYMDMKTLKSVATEIVDLFQQQMEAVLARRLSDSSKKECIAYAKRAHKIAALRSELGEIIRNDDKSQKRPLPVRKDTGLNSRSA